jgi:hypothetical protein
MATTLAEVLELASQLNPQEQAKLLEQIAGQLAQQIGKPETIPNESKHWGKEVLALLETLDTSDWEGTEDPVEWLKAQRKDSERYLDWGEEK